MRTTGGTRCSVAEAACPWGQLRSSGGGRDPSRNAKSQRICAGFEAEREGSEPAPRNSPNIKYLSLTEIPMVTLWLHDNVLAMSPLVLLSRSNYISVS